MRVVCPSGSNWQKCSGDELFFSSLGKNHILEIKSNSIHIVTFIRTVFETSSINASFICSLESLQVSISHNVCCVKRLAWLKGRQMSSVKGTLQMCIWQVWTLQHPLIPKFRSKALFFISICTVAHLFAFFSPSLIRTTFQTLFPCWCLHF